MASSENAPVKFSLPLDFQQTIFRELRKEDELLILARGLGLLRIVTNVLHSYDAAGDNLVVVVGADDRENSWIGESLAEHAVISAAPKCRGLQIINTDLTGVERRLKMYEAGGIFSITSQILIVDMLAGVLPPDKINGLVVLHAERVVAQSTEAFVIRSWREKNKTGFLKAVSDNPEPFTAGFAPLQTMMRNLFLSSASLYPRFQMEVASSLEGRRKAEVIELEVPMTDSMQTIQTAVMECIEVSLSDLKKNNSGLEFDDWNLDSGLHRQFDRIVRRQLDPVWHRTTFRTKQIVRDLNILQTILRNLLNEDAVSFNKYLDTVLAASQPPPGRSFKNPGSPWLYLDAANTIFETAKKRVYTGKPNLRENATARSNLEALQPVLEELPKWAVLSEVLEEIEREMYFNPQPNDTSSGAILIMCSDHTTCRQLRDYLPTMHAALKEETDEVGSDDEAPIKKSSAAIMMRRKLRNYLDWKRDFTKVSAELFAENEKAINGQGASKEQQSSSRGRAPPNKRRRVRGASVVAAASHRADAIVRTAGDKDAHVQSLLADLEAGADEEQPTAAYHDPMENMEDFYELFDTKDLVVIHPFDGDMDEHVLEEIKPRYVIMYEPDAAFIRRIEVYRSSHVDRTIRVYFIYYGGSVEEQRYLSMVRREKDAFTRLIRERGSMAMTLDTASLDPEEAFLRTINTRIAGGGRLAATAQQPVIVVDVREFRSSLPSLIHGRNIKVVPCMLAVGDFILTPNICVERKSLPDLTSSLSSGRLHNQVENMLRYYKSPMLLIEFDQNKSFTLQPFSEYSMSAAAAGAANSAQDLQSKLVLLTLAFPRLRVIWSSSPYQSAEIFEELKKLQDEPDPQTAVNIGLEDGEEAESGRAFNQAPLDMLREVPGVTEKNLTRITLHVNSLHELANMDEDEICFFMGREAGRQIHRFFNKSVLDG